MLERLAMLLIVPFVLLVGWWWWGNVGPAAMHEEVPGEYTSVQELPRDPDSGLRLVSVNDLPPQASETLSLIKSDGPYPYPADDGVFGNFEGFLPEHERGYYREYTVVTPGSDDRGARRIVVGQGGEYYWTNDHYRTFQRIEDP